MIEELAYQFNQHSNRENALQMKAYLRNQFEFFGLKAPLRRELTKNVIKNWRSYSFQEAIEIAKKLLRMQEREFHYASIELLSKYKKDWDHQLLAMMTYYTRHNAWWDTIDSASSKLLEPYFSKSGPNLQLLAKWNASSNFWQVRLSIIWQLHQKENTNPEILLNAILPHLQSKEFFIQKAIGWALRAYAKYNPEWVINITENYTLPALSKREALKHLIKD
jgi:3-methyladenine DNA glycosylase AlkD